MIEWNSLSGAISNLTLDALTGVAKTAFYSS